jgi:hypothetical protein
VVGQARRLERGVNSHVNATGSQVDQSCSGLPEVILSPIWNRHCQTSGSLVAVTLF